MASFEEQVQKACDAREIPGVILLASDANGDFKYEMAFGPKTPTEAMDLNATFILASCTKLMTSIAALQCVERGQITLDEPVSRILTELQEPDIITGFKDGSGEPTYQTAKTPITLRHLLTHSSGLGYHNLDPRYFQWRIARGEELRGGGIKGWSMIPRINTPLLFEPGTSWAYGSGLDWAGILVSRLNDMTLESYMQKHVWAPLGIKNITFHQESNAELRKNLVKMSVRKDNVALGLPTRNEEKVEWWDELLYDDPVKDDYGGEGAIGSPVEYMRILVSILADDGKLLKSETVEQMFQPQLSEEVVTGLDAYSAPLFGHDGGFAELKTGTKVNWGLGGMLFQQDYFSGRKKGTLEWSGMPNLLWTIDREAGLCLVYASNILPFGDFPSGSMQVKFEQEMYARAAKTASSPL